MPVDITYGTALGTNQLNATTTVPGSFVYSPPENTILPMGSRQALQVTFYPNDTGKFNSSTATVLLNVNKPLKFNSLDNGSTNRSDLLFQNTDGSLAAWMLDGISFKTGFLLTPSQVSSGWRIASNGDLNKDGKTDLLFQHEDGTLAVWYMNSNLMQNAELIVPNSSGAAWKLVTVNDFNRNGQLDLVFQHDDGTVAIWLMYGKTMLAPTYPTPASPGDPNWRIQGTADFNNDDQSDLLFQHQLTGELAVWLMNGLTLNEGSYFNSSLPAAGWKVKAVADYNKDGRPDLIFQKDMNLAVWLLSRLNLTEGQYLPVQLDDPAWRVVGPR